MEELLIGLSTVDLKDTALLIHAEDQRYFDRNPPKVFAYLDSKNEQVFLPEVLDYPIGISFAIYDDPTIDTSITPLLWTRGLHRYAEFDQPYAGRIAYGDGHVVYYEGAPNSHDSELMYAFGEKSGYSRALHILEHEPDDWQDKGLDALPIRFAHGVKLSARKELIQGWIGLLIFPTVFGLIAAAFCKGSRRKKVLCGAVTFVVMCLFVSYIGGVS